MGFSLERRILAFKSKSVIVRAFLRIDDDARGVVMGKLQEKRRVMNGGGA